VIETKQKIMDAAVRVFAEQGYGGTSLRHIIAEAQVNLAAIHYHFGSKEELLDAVIAQRLKPVNEQRLVLLDRVEARAGKRQLAVEDILDAFLGPAILLASQDIQFPRMMGRLIGEGLMQGIARQHFSEAVQRFQAALRRALPHLSGAELSWRIHFMIGAMAHCLCRGPEDWHGRALEYPQMLKELVTFLSAGFRAPSEAPSAATASVKAAKPGGEK
jgi:AcrR family transcriptional regulator